jgi:RNA polymerase sigma factor (sigma-70 family)
MSLLESLRRITSRTGATESDADLVRRFAASGDEAAFGELLTRHGPLVVGVCRRVLGNTHDAEDAAQAVFLVLARRAKAIRNHASLSCWLHGVAVRVCRKVLARRTRRATVAVPDTPAPPDADALVWAEARRAIDAALAALPISLRQPLVLCYLEGLTRDEAAERLGWSVSTFRGRLERGRDRLRALLVRRGFPLSAGLVAVLLSEPAHAIEPARLVTSAVPQSVETLTRGVVPAMKLWLLVPVAALGVVLAVYAAGNQKPDTPAVPKPAARLLKPDPKAPPVDKKFDGLWGARQDAPDGVFRAHELRFVDGEHMVWAFTQHSPGVRSSVTLRGKYEIKGGELRFTVLEKYVGEERAALRPEDNNPRVYFFKWLPLEQSPDRAAFELKVVGADPNSKSPWAVTQFARSQEAAGPPDPLVPEYLTGIDRTIKKEPKYTGAPLYLLLAFGPEAKERVWVVLDGAALYVDRNGNGDLTDDGVVNPLPDGGNPRSPAFLVGDLTVGGVTHTGFFLSAIRMNTGSVFTKLGVTVGGKVLQMAGPTNLRLTETAKEARVIHFGSQVVTAIPSHTMPSVPDANRADDFRVQVGTPGVGLGSFAAFGSESLAKGVEPVAEFEFAPLAGGEPKKLTVKLTERCCGDQFFAKVAVPDGVKTGLNAAKVTLTFPDSPWGAVAPATHAIDVLPKQKP